LFGRPGRCGALSGHVRYDLVIYLLFLGGRGKEKFWVQILHHLSKFGVVIYNTGCGQKPHNQCSIRLLAPIDNGKSFILLLISNALVSPWNEVCKRYANLIVHWTAKYPPRDRAASATFCRYKILSTSL